MSGEGVWGIGGVGEGWMMFIWGGVRGWILLCIEGGGGYRMLLKQLYNLLTIISLTSSFEPVTHLLINWSLRQKQVFYLFLPGLSHPLLCSHTLPLTCCFSTLHHVPFSIPWTSTSCTKNTKRCEANTAASIHLGFGSSCILDSQSSLTRARTHAHTHTHTFLWAMGSYFIFKLWTFIVVTCE